jgi:hypothetical protein
LCIVLFIVCHLFWFRFVLHILHWRVSLPIFVRVVMSIGYLCQWLFLHSMLVVVRRLLWLCIIVHIVSIRQTAVWLHLCQCLSFGRLPKQLQLPRLYITLQQLFDVCHHLHFLPNRLRVVRFVLHIVLPIWHVFEWF